MTVLGGRSLRAVRLLIALGGMTTALSLSACGSSQPKVGDCVDVHKHVVDCNSSSAAMKLVTDQSKPDAIACIRIGNNPEVTVKTGGGTFCAEHVSGSH